MVSDGRSDQDDERNPAAEVEGVVADAEEEINDEFASDDEDAMADLDDELPDDLDDEETNIDAVVELSSKEQSARSLEIRRALEERNEQRRLSEDLDYLDLDLDD